MRVLHVISGIEPENGGPTVALRGIATSTCKIGVRTKVVATWKSRSAFDQARDLDHAGIDVKLLGPTRRPFRTHPDTQRTLQQAIADADIVHIHAVWEDIQHRAARIAQRVNKPYIWSPHGLLDRWNMKRNHLFKRACLACYLNKTLDRATAIHAATDFERDQLARFNFQPPVIVQGFGIEKPPPQIAERGNWRNAHQIPTESTVLLYLGRIQHGKGLEYLIPALPLLQDQSVQLVIAGPDEGGYQKQIENLISQHQVSSRVRFTGMITGEKKYELLQDVDLLVAPSEHESFGIAVAEALCMGTPVVVSDQVGLAPEIIEHRLGEVCQLNPPHLALAIDSAQLSFAKSDPQRLRIRQWSQSRFDWDQVAVHFKNWYENFLNRTIHASGQYK